MHARTPSIGNDAVFCGVTCGLEIATEGTRSTDARVLLSSWLAGQLALLHAGVPEARYVHCGAGTRGCYCKPYYASTHRISLHGTKTGRCKVRTLLMGISEQLRKQEVHDKWNCATCRRLQEIKVDSWALWLPNSGMWSIDQTKSASIIRHRRSPNHVPSARFRV